MDRRAFLSLAAAAPLAAHPALAAAPGAHAFAFETLERRDGRLPLSDFAGRAVLVVNTASHCGFTPQYEGLQALWEARRGDGLTVIGAPSRDFGGQDYADEGKIRDFCESRFAVDFPLTELVKVTGPQAHPFYRWAGAEAQRRGLPRPRWNFHKYLIAPDGALAGAWPSAVTPRDPRIRAAIDALLPRG